MNLTPFGKPQALSLLVFGVAGLKESSCIKLAEFPRRVSSSGPLKEHARESNLQVVQLIRFAKQAGRQASQLPATSLALFRVA